VAGRSGKKPGFTATKYATSTSALKEFGGWASRLRADFGAGPASFVVDHRLVETDAASLDDLEAALRDIPSNGYELSFGDRSNGTARVRVVETATNAATEIDVPGALFPSPGQSGRR